MGNTLIKSGTVIDGCGNPAFKGHLLLQNDVIDSVFKENAAFPETDRVIDVTGCVIAPGFIDMHSHADWLLPNDDHPKVLKCMLEQGVTTLVGGNCGVSPAPVREDSIGIIEKFASMLIDKPFEYNWRSMTDFFDHMETTRPILNMAQLVGHASIRYAAADTTRGKMTLTEIQRCLNLAQRSLDEGACGLSFGLGYDPGMYSPLDELEAFCRVASKTNKPVAVHLKALSRISPCYHAAYLKAHNIRALKEMIGIAQRTGSKLQLSHFIFVGRNSWSTAPACLNLVEEARSKGIDVMIDAYPYTCGNTTINVPIPYWFLAMLPDGYTNKWVRARLRIELELGFRLVGFTYKDFQVMDVAVEEWEALNGLTITDIARKWKTSPFNAMLKLSKKSNGATLMLYHTYSGEPGNEQPLKSVLSHDLCLFETDAILRSRGFRNPAGTGTFPRILGKYVRDEKLLSIEDAVNRMTCASAERFGIKDRGSLAPGKAADVVVFNPDKISDSPPTGRQPWGSPKGIEHVFINGTHAVKDGVYIDNVRSGKFLRI